MRHPTLFLLWFTAMTGGFGQSVVQCIYTPEGSISQSIYTGVENAHGGFLMAMRPVILEGDDTFDAVLLHTDAEGNILWTNRYALPGGQMITAVERAPNGDSWVVMHDSLLTDMVRRGLLMHLGPEDEHIGTWKAQQPSGSAIGFHKTWCLPDGDVLVSGEIDEGGVRSVLLARLTGSGEVSWARRVHASTTLAWNGTLQDGDKLVLAGFDENTLGASGAALACFNTTGDLEWTAHYPLEGFAQCNDVQYKPGQGILLSYGRPSDPQGAGLTLLTDELGGLIQARRYGNEILCGYGMADGSQVVFLKLPGGAVGMERVTPDGEVPWAVGAGECLGFPSISAFAENSMYAFFSGDMSQNVKVSTFTAECFTCEGGPGVVDVPTGITLGTGELLLSTGIFDLQLEPVDVVTSSMVPANAVSCRASVGLDVTPPIPAACEWNPGTAELFLAGRESTEVIGLRVSDVAGREIPWSKGPSTPDGTFFRIPQDPGPGIHIARFLTEGMQHTCSFVVSAR